MDYDALESNVGNTLKESYAGMPVEVAGVDCQRIDDPMPHDTFTCLADIGAPDKVRVEVTVTAINDYKVDYETVDVVFDLADTVDVLQREISDFAETRITVDCGEGIIVVAVGDTFVCRATEPVEDESADIVVTAKNAQGDVSWEVVE
ncbi:hypothetical protein CRI77_07930 [Mycolicibacterium duvalii]|uniref:Uncharacterized protein n=1 Tax=Mycolicibacterium duvalii TaxID=39688 RepID=A0A7I7K4R6_9MYCO|nr:hypothetical protein CRI77_07930 [Mycolicibacterium duvalii]BBX18594.1 hypothetical protein MDUV_34540 [Mycolicibacterium duvalii]